jgi:hypothetical protein
MDIVTPHLNGTVLEFLIHFRKYVDDKKSSFKKELRNRFTPHDRDNKIRRELQTIRHVGNFEKFKLKFLSLVNQYPDKLSEEQLVFLFYERT